jgi:hypothetical protein
MVEEIKREFSDLEWQVIIDHEVDAAKAKQQNLELKWDDYLEKRGDNENVLDVEDVRYFFETIKDQKDYFDDIYFRRLPKFSVNPLEREQAAWKLLSPVIKEYLSGSKNFVETYSANVEERASVCDFMEKGYELLLKWRVIQRSYGVKSDVAVYRNSKLLKMGVTESMPHILENERKVEELITELSEVPEIPADWHFELLGHAEWNIGDSPIFSELGIEPGDNSYPYWVVPIGLLEERPAAIYVQPEGVVKACYLLDLSQYVMYDDKVKDQLSDFDFRQRHLFAFDRDDVVCYDGSSKVDLISSVLSDERFEEVDTFRRLSIAYGSKNPGLMLGEIKRCARHLEGDDFLATWYQGEIDLIRRPEERLGLGMPEFATELEQPGMLEALMVDN